jgi:TetR/AcrR family transcriptional regulator, repressor of fatR-cypB operon
LNPHERSVLPVKCVATPKKSRVIDPEDKAERVLSCARHLFVEKGYHRVSIPDIVSASGVSTGAIYNLFGNKENLARVLHTNTLERFQASFEERLRGRITTYEKLRAFAELVYDLTETDPAMMEYMLFMRHAEFMDGAAPVCLTEPFKLVREIVIEGMARGEVKKGDFFVCAVSYTGAILRPAQLRLECVLQKPMPEMAEEFIENAWAAIRA